METEKHYLKVGVFVLAVLAIFAWSVMILGGGENTRNLVRYKIFFDSSVAGLSKGAPVRLHGLDIGSVVKIGFVSSKDDRIEVVVDLARVAPIRRDTVAEVAFQGITATTYLTLENTRGREDVPPLEPAPGEEHAVIPAKKSDIQLVLTSVPELIAKLVGVAEQAQKLLKDRNIETIEGDLAQVREVLTEATGALRELKMLARTLREDPSAILRGSDYEGYKVKKGGKEKK